MPSLPTITHPELLKIAFTHRSALNEHRDRPTSNERLEFLGDAVLELIVSRYLYDTFPNEPEGTLTFYRSALVKTQTLAVVAKELDLGSMMVVSKGEEQSGGRENEALLANTFEAFLGALYLDQGYDAADRFLHQTLLIKLDAIRKKRSFKDPKSELQESLQAKGQQPPVYVVERAEGPDHKKEFEIAVLVDGKKLTSASGKNKHEAQQKAAERALEILKRT